MTVIVVGIVEVARRCDVPALEVWDLWYLAVHILIHLRIFLHLLRYGIGKEQRTALEVYALSFNILLLDGHRQCQCDDIAFLHLFGQSREGACLQFHAYSCAVDADRSIVAPCRDAQCQRYRRPFLSADAECQHLAEGIFRSTGDGQVALCRGEGSLTGPVDGGHSPAIVVFHPHAAHHIRQHAVDVARAAFRLVCRTIGHPRGAVFIDVVVG